MEAWYSSLAMLPPFRTQVRVQWRGRVFNALRTIHPKKRTPTWVTMQGGEIVYLPPKGRSRSWGDNPELWQPLVASEWPHDLPEPIHGQPEVEWRRQIPSAEIEPDSADWWRDASLIRYSELGNISLREAEGRVMRSICTGWTINLGAPRVATNAAVIARLSETKSQLSTEYDFTTGQYLDPNRDWRAPFQPTGHDRDDYLVAGSWFAALNPPELRHKQKRIGALNRAQQVLTARAMDPPLPWVFLGGQFGVTDERIRQIYKDSVDKVWRAANGKPVFKHVTPSDQMAALRGRNRAYARGR